MVDAALIYEWGDEARYDVVVVVDTPKKIATKRAADRLGLTVEDISDRWRMQLPAKVKIQRADIVLRNNGSLEELVKQACAIWKNKILPGLENGFGQDETGRL